MLFVYTVSKLPYVNPFNFQQNSFSYQNMFPTVLLIVCFDISGVVLTLREAA